MNILSMNACLSAINRAKVTGKGKKIYMEILTAAKQLRHNRKNNNNNHHGYTFSDWFVVITVNCVSNFFFLCYVLSLSTTHTYSKKKKHVQKEENEKWLQSFKVERVLDRFLNFINYFYLKFCFCISSTRVKNSQYSQKIF